MEQLSKGNGESTVLSAYSSSVINLSNSLTTSLGATGQYFTLNKNWSIEPRVALKWEIKPAHSLAVAYGLHSRRERLDYYFVEPVSYTHLDVYKRQVYYSGGFRIEVF